MLLVFMDLGEKYTLSSLGGFKEVVSVLGTVWKEPIREFLSCKDTPVC